MPVTMVDKPYVTMIVGDTNIYTFPMKVKELIQISYVSVRGKDKEEGAVQRVLNGKRISSIKQYVLSGNMFVNTFVINWNDNSGVEPTFGEKGKILVPLINSSAQLLDGQHRLEGIKEAAKEDVSILDKDILVSMTLHLDTKAAAKIFININSEQKPVPKSLIYDLYGITEEDRNFAISRCDDIAEILNTNIDSPYYNLIKYPGNPKAKGKIDLSTVVTTLKKYVDTDGKFVDKNIKDLNLQSQILINYFTALKYHCDKENLWSNASQNVFFKASGFIAAIDFFFEYVFTKCADNRSFKTEDIVKMFNFVNGEIITNDEIKGSDGKSARKKIFDNLKNGLKTETIEEDDYAI